MIGSIYQKSPPNTMIFPPKIIELSFLTPMISLKLLSNTSKQCLCAIGASSHMINLVNFKSSTCSLPWWMLHIELSRVGTSILNFECVVLSFHVVAVEMQFRLMLELGQFVSYF